MPDQTNITDFDPATGRTTTTLVSDHDRGAQQWAAETGQEHDTWHRPDGGTEPPAALTVTSMTPNPVPYSTIVTGKVIGTGFVDGAMVYWGLTTPGERATTFISATELDFQLSAQAVSGNYKVEVWNPDGSKSNKLTVPVAPKPTPTMPVITSTDPVSIIAAVPTLVRVLGTDFKSDAVIFQVGLGTLATTFVSATELTTTVTGAAAGTINLQVQDATPDWYSQQYPLTVTAAVQDDPSAYTIDYIKEWVDDNPDFADEVLAAEQARGGDGRVTLLFWLQGFIAHRDED